VAIGGGKGFVIYLQFELCSVSFCGTGREAAQLLPPFLKLMLVATAKEDLADDKVRAS